MNIKIIAISLLKAASFSKIQLVCGAVLAYVVWGSTGYELAFIALTLSLIALRFSRLTLDAYKINLLNEGREKLKQKLKI
ncbi:hypothetical protein D6L34_23515 [Vibrio parahaemolyticus]|nr:hypothetical protein [Vibrio parahaemolyticus]EGR1629553.1 hypothetical protein [Vibrio parahaemolyticus]EGR1649706.1 hypothetical protein [Vibrio parahaemolyticus]